MPYLLFLHSPSYRSLSGPNVNIYKLYRQLLTVSACACRLLISQLVKPQLNQIVHEQSNLLLPFAAARDLESDSEPYEEREPSRTVVKFSEDASQEKDTPFVRQNTPHPKDLKAKAQKLKVERSRHEENANLVALPEEVNDTRRSSERVQGSSLCVYFKCP